MPHVFISYSREDRDFVENMMTKLKDTGFETWSDTSKLRAGVDWGEGIDNGILSAFALILVMSPASKASEYVTYEWSFAMGAGVRVVPVLLRNVEIHPRLRRLHYLDFQEKERPWENLFSVLETARADKSKQTREIPPHLQRATQDLDAANADDRRGAIDVLAELSDPTARDILRKALTHPLRDVRGRVAVQLGELRDESIETEAGLIALKDALAYQTRDKEDDTIHKAHGLLRELGSVAFPVIESTSKIVDDPARFAAVELLSTTGGEKATATLVSLITDPDRNIARSAIKQVGSLRARMAVDALLKLVGREDVSSSSAVEGLHGVLARALVDIGDESIMPRLVEAARHQSPVVRMCAAQVLGELCGPAAIPTLQELLSDDATANYMWYYENGKGSGGPMMSVSKIAAVSLDHIKTPEAIGLLREYRVTHPRPDSGWGLGHLSIDEEPIKKNPPPPRLTL